MNSQSPIETQLQEARHLFSSGRFDEAIELVDNVHRQHEDDARTLVLCAQTLGYCYEISRAEALLERAIELVAPEQQAQIALVFHQVFRPHRAMTILEQLRAKQMLALPHLAQLAKLYEQSNRRDEAIAALQECVAKAPSQPQPKVLLGRLQRQAGNVEAAEDLLTAGTTASAPLATQVHAWSELAQLRDQLGQYREAVTAIEQAKSRLREVPDVQHQARRSVAINKAFAQLYENLQPETIQAWMKAPIEPIDVGGVAHLLGFPRSGTTLVEQVLDAHPEICAASERAVFSKAIFPALGCNDARTLSFDRLSQCPADQIDLLRRRYVHCHRSIAGELGTNPGKFVLLDKNPNHTSLLLGLVRLLPESKFLFALRDPRDVVVSTYMRFFSLSEFSASYLTWQSTCALYAHEMRIWLMMRSLLPANWLEVRYEDSVTDLEHTTRQIAALLGLQWNEQMLHYRDDQRKFVYSPTHAEVRKPVYRSSIGRWSNYEEYLQPHLRELEPFIKAFGYD